MFSKRSLKISSALIAMALAVLACSLPGTATPTPTAVVVTPTVVTATPTPSLPVVSSPQIISFQMLDANNGWALTDTNVLRTTDGGATWYNVTPSGVSSTGFSTAPYYLNATTAWLAMPGTNPTNGTLYHTTDGGASWSSIAVPFGGGSLKFPDASHGWEQVELEGGMSHQSVAVFTTRDGGTTWSQVFTDDPNASGSSDTLPLLGDKNGITAVDASHAWVTGAEPVNDFVYIYITQDGGHSWTHQDVAIPGAYAGGQENTDPPIFIGSMDGVLPVGVFASTNVTIMYVSHDGGATWTASTPVSFSRPYSVVSASLFFVWDGSTTMHVSADAGATWKDVTTNLNVPDTLVSFQFVNATTGWALTGDATPHYTFYKTTDGGATWTILIP
jgi:photosystem II stability/assembly factor-like uncharacterized protein